MDWIRRANPHGRWLLAYSRPYTRNTPLRLAVVPTSALTAYLRSGWLIVAEDPDPLRYDKDTRGPTHRTDPEPDRD